MSTEFQSSQLEITKKSLEHYSTESRASQTAPWSFSNSELEVLAKVREERGVWPADSSV